MKSAILAIVAILATAVPGRADDLQEAQLHFKRGVELYEESDFPAAFVEFRRAYDLVPNYRVLYNLGRVAASQHDYAAAVGYYRRYLSDGGTQLAPARRREVEDELARLVTRVGQLRVIADVAGAQVTIDDVPAGLIPLPAPVAVNAGRRRVTVTAVGAAPVARVVEIAGEELLTVALQMSLPAIAPPPAPRAAPEPRPFVRQPARAPRKSRTWPVALCWTSTGLLAAGSAVAGIVAVTSQRELQQRREAFPASPADLAEARQKTRTSALLTDGLLAGTALMTAISLYVTLSGPGDSAVSIGPGGVRLSGRF